MENGSFFDFIGKCCKRIKDPLFREEVVSIGRDGRIIYYQKMGALNPDKRFYVIDFRDVKGLGMCALIRFTLDKLIYSEFHGCIPLILWGTKTYYSEESDPAIGMDAFIKFFQPLYNGFSEEEILNSYFVAFSTLGDIITKPIHEEHSYKSDNDMIKRYAKVYSKYFTPSDGLEQYIMKSSIIPKNKKVLGVHYRGTDYKKNFRGHPKFVTIDEYIESTKKIVDKYDMIFIATDDEEAINAFMKAFPEKTCYYKDTLRSNNSEAVHGSKNSREHHELLLGYEVLRDVYTLSKCNGLIATMSNVPTISRIVNQSHKNPYEDLLILNKGENNTGHKFSDKR